MTGPRLYLHIGLQKTGTSFIQRILWDSTEELSRQGVDLVPGSKVAMFRLALDVRDRFNPEFDPPAVGRSVARLPAQLSRAADTALITQESLASASPEQIRRLLDAASGREVHVILTLRDLGRQIPSAWQQTIQSGRSEPLDRYVRRLERRAGQDARVWGSMNIPAVLERWRAFVPDERIHLVTVPPTGGPREELLTRFCSVVGIDHTRLTIDPDSRGNRSLRAQQAEVLRRVNELLPPEVKQRNVYGDIGKRYFAVQILGADTGTRIQLPAALYPWCREISQGFIEHISAGSFPVVGDLSDLLPALGDFAPEGVRVAQRDVAAAATRALADMLVDRWAGQREEPGQVAVSAPESAPSSVLARGWRRLTRRWR